MPVIVKFSRVRLTGILDEDPLNLCPCMLFPHGLLNDPDDRSFPSTRETTREAARGCFILTRENVS